MDIHDRQFERASIDLLNDALYSDGNVSKLFTFLNAFPQKKICQKTGKML